jgi:hypothetical protein
VSVESSDRRVRGALSRLRSGKSGPSLAAALLLGCTGKLGEMAGPSANPGLGTDMGQSSEGLECEGKTPEVGPSVLRRLSNAELQLTLQDLFQLPSPPSVQSIPADNAKQGFRTFADVQALSAQHLRAYLDLARELADGLLSDPARRAAVIGCEPASSGCLRSFVQRFGKLAYRRELTAEELDTLTARAKADALDATDQLRYSMQALLGSPNFLYRIELGDTPEGVSTLDPNELATKLSFGLWGRAPTLALLRDAEQGKLDTAEGMREVAQEMLADPRASYFYLGFFRQWLGYETLRAPNVAPKGWSDALLPQMQSETDAVLTQHGFGGTSFLEALTTNQTVLTPELASFYGLPAPGAGNKLTIPGSSPRADSGILGHASLLSLKSDGDPVALRGNWLRRTFFCSELRIPPEVAADLGDLLVGLSPVEVVAKRNTETACKGCHGLIDPIGVGLANIDASGRFDPKADIREFGITPVVPDLESAEFDSLGRLAGLLKDSPAVGACLSEKVFLYMSGRDAEAHDRCALQEAHGAFSGAGDFRALLASIVASPSFRLRRASAPVDIESE